MAEMELMAKPSRAATRRRRVRSEVIFHELVRRYSQTEQPFDPSQLQVGQSVYGPEGNEYLVVENAPDTTNTVLMPADQAGAAVPEGVETLDSAELEMNYSLQPATGLATTAVIKKLREEDKDGSGKEWGLYTSDGSKLLGRHETKEDALQQEKAIKAHGGSRIIAGYVDEDNPSFSDPPDPTTKQVRAPDFAHFGPQEPETPEWSPGSGGPRTPRYDPLTHSQDTQTSAPRPSGPVDPDDKPPRKERPLRPYLHEGALRMDIGELEPYRQSGSPLENGPGWDSEEDMLRIGESGYTDVMNDIRALVDGGYSTIDVILNIGELYPRDLGERVLSEARKKGII